MEIGRTKNIEIDDIAIQTETSDILKVLKRNRVKSSRAISARQDNHTCATNIFLTNSHACVLLLLPLLLCQGFSNNEPELLIEIFSLPQFRSNFGTAFRALGTTDRSKKEACCSKKKMELSTIKDAFERVVKKQKLCSSRSQEVIDLVGREIEQTLTRLLSVHDPTSPVDYRSILAELKFKLNGIGPIHQLEGSHKELNGNLSKYTKFLEKSLNPDISKAYRDVDFDHHIENQLIANHFYRQGSFDLGDGIIDEAGEPESTILKSQFVVMHQILEAMKVKNLEPALNWVSANREKLNQCGSNLELKLHSLQFLEILKKGTQADALKYARTCLAPFASPTSPHKEEVLKLMGCLLYPGRLDSSPYSAFTSPTHWEKSMEDLTRQFCSLLGQSYNSPLSMTIAAGLEGLPTLLKLANVMAAKKQEWQAMKQLPVPVELGKEFQFHSIFVCPVSRDQGSEENPPMLMPCLHVLCKQSILKLTKSSTRTFKCPYCPAEASAAQCRQLYF